VRKGYSLCSASCVVAQATHHRCRWDASVAVFTTLTLGESYTHTRDYLKCGVYSVTNSDTSDIATPPTCNLCNWEVS